MVLFSVFVIKAVGRGPQPLVPLQMFVEVPNGFIFGYGIEKRGYGPTFTWVKYVMVMFILFSIVKMLSILLLQVDIVDSMICFDRFAHFQPLFCVSAWITVFNSHVEIDTSTYF